MNIKVRKIGEGPWLPAVLEEDLRRLAKFKRARMGAPWDEVKTWMQSWGTPNKLPPPKPRKLSANVMPAAACSR